MKITVLAYGSRGDVQPMIVLAHQLALRGHELSLAVPANDVAVARQLAGRVVELPLDGRAVLREGRLLDSLREGRNIAFFSEGMRLERAHRVATGETLIQACAGADLLVVPPLLEDLALCIAEAHRQRVAFVLPMPMWSNSRYPSFFFATRRLPGWLNRFTFTLTEIAARRVVPAINELRAPLGLAPVRERPSLAFRRARPPVFYGLPARVVPPPPEFGDNHHFTGYWSVPPAVRRALGESAPPAGLQAFLDAGAPPLFIGFGSMPVLDERVCAVIDRVAERLDRRVVLCRGWSSAGAPRSERVFIVDQVDHDWLLPRCAAAVHHGGASTTGAVLRAGLPQVVASVFADQPIWGRRVHELGVGETFRFQRLSAERLERALVRALEVERVARARALGAELAAEPDGAEVTADFIHARAAGFPIPRTTG